MPVGCYSTAVAERAFSFDAGRISLDLLATLGNRRDERLPDPAGLEAWLLAGGLIDKPCDTGEEDLRQARELRGALFGVVDAVLYGENPSPTDLESINAAATRARAPRLAVGVHGLRDAPRSPSVREVLGSIARDAIELLTGPQRELLRECTAEDCSGIYVDASPARTRRWCSTARCGNRARVAAHRARRRDTAEQTSS